jgi:hypothetical protein
MQPSVELEKFVLSAEDHRILLDLGSNAQTQI